MVRSILNWTDAKFEAALQDPNSGRSLAKSAGLGMLEGAIDACVVLGVFSAVCSVIAIAKK